MKKTITTIFASTVLVLLCSCSLFKTTEKNTAGSSVAETRYIVTNGGNEPLYHAPTTIATTIKYEIDLDSMTGNGYSFEVPESMKADIDSLLNSWQARNMLRKLECDGSGWENLVITDTMYAKRLASMPTIVRMPYNNMVRSCIDRYVKNGRSQVSYLLGISELYFPIIEEEIDRLGVPHELKYLPIIESALNPKAASRMGAKGLWQFMFSTGKLYELKANNYIDERFDPVKSTKAALLYLKDLYDMFQSWELAIAAYNCGPGNVKKAISRSGGSTDFWKIYPWLPKETRGYLPGFIAANYIMTFYEDHGICPMEPNLPITTDTIHVNKNLHFKQIVEVCGADIEEIRALNPQFLKDIIPGENETYILRLTNSTITKFIENEEAVYNHDVEKYFPKVNIEKMLKEAKENNGAGNLIRHKIKNGETLGGIALKYKVSVKQIMKWNNMKNSNIRAGKYLKIYK
ncbi:MAG: transglycosylase SLT domain-containing protein [Bacteroidaceae bacterium]|nr:transglycosylase SLT domain-containing protein [Bacteroidaceae bacterium]